MSRLIWMATAPANYVRKAKRTKIKVTRTYTHLTKMSQSMANAVHVNLVRGVRTFKKRLSVEKMAEAWERGGFHEVTRLVPWEHLEKDLEPAGMSLAPAILRASNAVITSLPPQVDEGLRFDMTNPRIRDHVSERVGNITQGITDDGREVIRQQVQASFENGLTPRQVAENIKDSIGLTDKYATAVANYKDRLTKEGKFDEDKISSMGERYADQLLSSRAMAIARSETRAAVNNGQQEVWLQASEKGMIDPKSTRIWIVDGDPCHLCEPMDGVEVSLNEPWVLSDGTMCYVPSDAHPNCFCGMELNLADTEADYEEQEENAPDEEEEETA